MNIQIFFSKLNLLLGVIIFTLIFSSCCTETVCVDFTPEELAWAPYTKGDTIKFKSSLTDSVISFLIKSVDKGNYNSDNCVTSKGVCQFWFTTISIPVKYESFTKKKFGKSFTVYGHKELTNPPNDPNNTYIKFEYSFVTNTIQESNLYLLDIIKTKSISNYQFNGLNFKEVKLNVINNIEVPFDSIWVALNYGLTRFHIKDGNEYFNLIFKK